MKKDTDASFGSWRETVPTAKDAGTYAVEYRILGDDEYKTTAETTVSSDIVIQKAPLTAKIKDVTISVESDVPDISENPLVTLTFEGLVEGETIAKLKESGKITGELFYSYPVKGEDETEPAAGQKEYANGDPVGQYWITAAYGEKNSTLAVANYALTFVNGTLTVSEKPPIPPIEKDNLEIGKKEIDTVPESIRDAHPEITTPEKLKDHMMKEVISVFQLEVSVEDLEQKGSLEIFDISLKVKKISDDGTEEFVELTKDNFPTDGIDVTLPYPDGTDASYSFSGVHICEYALGGYQAGDTEKLEPVAGSDGLQIHLSGLSPVLLTWEKTDFGLTAKVGAYESVVTLLGKAGIDTSGIGDETQFTSSNPDVVLITGSGTAAKATALRAGKAVITFDGSTQKLTLVITEEKKGGGTRKTIPTSAANRICTGRRRLERKRRMATRSIAAASAVK